MEARPVENLDGCATLVQRVGLSLLVGGPVGPTVKDDEVVQVRGDFRNPSAAKESEQAVGLVLGRMV